MWCKEEYAATATCRTQLAADKLNSWTDKWRVAVNKSFTILFTLFPKPPLKDDEAAAYLGITFDQRQTWKPHIAKAKAKARGRMAILRTLAGNTLGASEKNTENSVPGNS